MEVDVAQSTLALSYVDVFVAMATPHSVDCPLLSRLFISYMCLCEDSTAVGVGHYLDG